MLPCSLATVYVPMYTFAVTHWRARRETHNRRHSGCIKLWRSAIQPLFPRCTTTIYEVGSICVLCLHMCVTPVMSALVFTDCNRCVSLVRLCFIIQTSILFFLTVINPFKHTTTRWEHASCTRTRLSFLSITQLIRLTCTQVVDFHVFTIFN